MASNIETKVEQLLEKIIVDLGYDLYDVRYEKEAKDYYKDQYFLEVSSPGLERILRKEKHFLSQIGKEVSVKLFKPINKQKELIGILEEYNNTELTIKVDDETIKINLKDIALVKTMFNW